MKKRDRSSGSEESKDDEEQLAALLSGLSPKKAARAKKAVRALQAGRQMRMEGVCAARERAPKKELFFFFFFSQSLWFISFCALRHRLVETTA